MRYGRILYYAVMSGSAFAIALAWMDYIWVAMLLCSGGVIYLLAAFSELLRGAR